MNTQKPIYLLAGGRGRKILTTISNVRNIIKGINKVKPGIAYVGVASLKDNWLIYFIISILIKAGCDCRLNRILIAPKNADLNRARETLQSADAIFIGGGDVEVGMQVLKEKNMVGFFRDLAKKNKLFIGVSAGSIIIAKEWVRWRNPNDDSTAELFPCLGLVPIICDTHAEEEDWEELKIALQLKGAGTCGYGIASGTYLKVYPDGRLEPEIGPVARYIFQNGRIERQPDLLSADHAE